MTAEEEIAQLKKFCLSLAEAIYVRYEILTHLAHKKEGGMARAHFVKKAQKDYPEVGIKKGESYWWWAHFRGGRHLSKNRPKPSQLAGSEFISTLLGLQEVFDAKYDNTEDVKGEVENVISELESLRDDTQGKYDNMPEGLQQGDTGQLLEQRVEGLDTLIQELESIDFEEEGLVLDDLISNIQQCSWDMD
jgi:hypothetical protein